MYIAENENTAYFDVDETLVMHHANNKDLYVVCPYTNVQEHLTVHREHVRQLIKNKARGNFIVVWSHAGYKWAEAVIRALQLEDHVDLIIGKPGKAYDDMEPNDFLTNRVYLPFRG